MSLNFPGLTAQEERRLLKDVLSPRELLLETDLATGVLRSEAVLLLDRQKREERTADAGAAAAKAAEMQTSEGPSSSGDLPPPPPVVATSAAVVGYPTMGAVYLNEMGMAFTRLLLLDLEESCVQLKSFSDRKVRNSPLILSCFDMRLFFLELPSISFLVPHSVVAFVRSLLPFFYLLLLLLSFSPAILRAEAIEHNDVARASTVVLDDRRPVPQL